MTNPFLGYGRVVTGERLIGRESETFRLDEMMQTMLGSISVIGEPRIGKTSLVYKAYQNLCSNCCARAWITLSTVSSPTLVFQDMQEKIIDDLEFSERIVPHTAPNNIISENDSTYDAYKKFRRFLKNIFSKGIYTLCILDEFDAVTEYPTAKQFIQSLRELIDFPQETGFSAIFISRRSLYHLERQLSGVSNLDGVCEKIYLGPLPTEDLRRMTLRCGTDWNISDDEAALLYSCTGGHPYLSEMVLCKAWDEKSVSRGIEISLGDIYSYYENLRLLLNEDELFDQLLQVSVGPCMATNLEKIQRLVKYGIALKKWIGEDSFLYRGWSDHFQSYLEKVVRTNPISADWSLTENLIRGLIAEQFSRKYGDGWSKHLEAAYAKAKDIFEDCSKRMEKEIGSFGSYASTNILDYAYPMDLWKLIECDWTLFQPVFKKDKQHWRARFEMLSKVRTPIAHSRESCLPPYILQEAKAYCHEIQQIFSEFKAGELKTSPN